MRLVFGFVLILGVGLAGFAVYMAKNYIQGYQAQLEQERAAYKPPIETVDVYVASEKLEYGQRLLKKHVKVVGYPKEHLPEGVFLTEEELFPEGEDEPRSVVRTMEPLEVVLNVKVTDAGADAGLTYQLAPGMRAFAIRVDVASGVSGFLRPGDRVDVYWTGSVNISRERSTEVTKLIQSAVRLIAVDQVSNEDDSASATIARTVTVSVKPAQVAALAQAQSTGVLSLSLVGAGEESIAENIEVDQKSLLGIVEVEAPELEQERKCFINTRRGGELIKTEIKCADDSGS
ncbi:MAG: Flp pilus assembly protein CpaB [Pseudomonadota bacterium]